MQQVTGGSRGSEALPKFSFFDASSAWDVESVGALENPRWASLLVTQVQWRNFSDAYEGNFGISNLHKKELLF